MVQPHMQQRAGRCGGCVRAVSASEQFKITARAWSLTKVTVGANFKLKAIVPVSDHASAKGVAEWLVSDGVQHHVRALVRLLPSMPSLVGPHVAPLIGLVIAE